MHIIWVIQNQENHLHSCNLSHVKYFQMSENLILLPLLFSNVFLGYRGLQYIQYVYVFLVISLFFTCKKSKFSCPGLQMNSHANFTCSYPQLNIILIPTVIRSIRFSVITLIAGIGSPIPEILLLCDIDLLHIFLCSSNFINKAYCYFYNVVLSKMWHWQSEGRQITQHASY